jgi:hypothetical protein
MDGLSRGEQARVNGARSRGPTSEEGKARASRNRLGHGFYAERHPVLDGEDAAAFAGLRDGLVAELLPEDTLETALVHRLAATLWKLERADAMEAQLARAALATDPDAAPEPAPAGPPLLRDLAAFTALERHQARLGRELDRLARLLERRRQRVARDDDHARAAAERAEDRARRQADTAAIHRAMQPPDWPSSPLVQEYEALIRQGRLAEAKAVLARMRAASSG